MIKELLQKRFTAKHWNKEPVPADKLNYILECLYLTPSKNGKYNWKVYVLGDTTESKLIKEWLFWENTWCLDKERVKLGEGMRRYNGQVLAPAVLCFVAENENSETENDIMVAATIAILAAEEQGLNSGFNGCVGQREVAEKLGLENEEYAVVLVGIGYVDHMDTKDIGTTQEFIGRSVFKDSKQVGFDYGNVAANNSTNSNRKSKPNISTLIKFL
tara:strand:- start:122 stop:769 length:648 start_codon:yes stop_codon:yes gene_type:complete